MTLAIRSARAEDMAAIASIYEEAVLHGTATFETEPPSPGEMLARFERLASGGFPYLVCCDDDVVLGYGYAGPYRPRPAYRFTVEDSIYLAANARGRGLGRRLLTAIIDQSRAQGFAQMVAVIGDSRNTASIGLHASMGFSPVGTLKDVGWKFERWLDTVLMQLPLGDPGRSRPAERP